MATLLVASDLGYRIGLAKGGGGLINKIVRKKSKKVLS